jgi:hypothetical protein
MNIRFSGSATALFLLCCLHWSIVLAAPHGPAGDVLVYERQGSIWTCDGNGQGEKRLSQGFRPGVDAGGVIYFIGYRDTQAAGEALFRVLRVDRFGSNLRELTLGESVSVGVRANGLEGK